MERAVLLKNISKSYSGVKALKNVTFSLNRGEIKGLVGENGAGKSTLIKVLSGAIQMDEGEIQINGETLTHMTPKVSIDRGISVIYQEFVLAPHLSVAENIFLDRLSDGHKLGLTNNERIVSETKSLLEKIGFSDIDPLQLVGELTVAYQQIVEICKALSRNTKILVLDEPTAVLTFKEVRNLMKILRQLKNQGIAIIYISHRLNEIFEICDTVHVMKDGESVSEYSIEDVTEDKIVKDMVGRDLTTLFPDRETTIGEIILEVERLNAGRQVKNISFNVRKGEVVGFFGLVGSGRTETMKVIFGDDPKESGKLFFKNEEKNFRSSYDVVRDKIGMVPEDRKNEGILLNLSILLNTTITNLRQISKLGIINKKEEKEMALHSLTKLQTKYSDLEDSVSSLSGGNQQKVSLAKWLSSDCECLILDEPTRGVDVGAKVEIYNNINELASEGYAILMISSEMQEIINMCDRVYIMREGEIAGELTKENLKEERIMSIAMGVNNEK
ncbi:MAG TPA: sugar ABC transporter ATP-binding protein [Clostridiaceae bacterium]|nr:sugar ABC transporter ATP-binding protein [Clostridiaceae bacterium]